METVLTTTTAGLHRAREAALVVSLLLFTILASSSAANQTAAPPDLRREDENVLRLVLDRMIFPELAKFGSRVPAPMLLVGDQTISLDGTGRIPDRWQRFLKPDPTNGWPGLIADAMRRQKVIDSFESRNARSHELPDLGRSDLMRVGNERIAEVRQQYSDRPLGVARFSLPGYSLDGYAMMLASYGCGDLCGVSWLIVLDNTTGHWRVENTFPLSVS
jgi:hypothetical protein